jgi:hypothetical protein
MSDPFEQTIRARLADLAASRSSDAESRLIAVDYTARATRQRKLWTAGGAFIALGAAVVAAMLAISSGGSASLPPLNGASYSLAGWTSVPTASDSRLLRSATRSCDQGIARFAYVLALRKQRPKGRSFGYTLQKSATTSVENVLTDARDKYVAVVALDENASYVCINGDRVGQGSSTFRDKGILAAPQTGSLTPARVIHFGGVGYVNGTRVAGLEAGNHAYGRAGRGVTAVLFGFANGRTVDATVEHGWYFAWWPWGSSPNSVQVTNRSGTFRSTTTCEPRSSGCMFSASPNQ